MEKICKILKIILVKNTKHIKMPFLNFKSRHFSHEERNAAHIVVKHSIPILWGKLTGFTLRPYLQSIDNKPMWITVRKCQAFIESQSTQLQNTGSVPMH